MYFIMHNLESESKDKIKDICITMFKLKLKYKLISNNFFIIKFI